MTKPLLIAVDFDGTIVTHMYPEVGAPVPNAVKVLKRLRDAGATLMLWTMRSGPELQEAVDYCTENGIVLSHVNERINQKEWTQSPKLYAQFYIDDAAVGCPTLYDAQSNRQMVNWKEIEAVFTRQGILL